MNFLIYFCAVWLGWVMVAGLIVYFFFTKKKISVLRLIGLSSFSAGLAWVITSLIKYNWPSPRPFEVINDLLPLFVTDTGDAFPSGHATFFGALAVGVWLQKKKLGIIFIIGALLVAIARVLAGVHWPADVIAGLAVGSLVSLIVYLVFNHFSAKIGHI